MHNANRHRLKEVEKIKRRKKRQAGLFQHSKEWGTHIHPAQCLARKGKEILEWIKAK